VPHRFSPIWIGVVTSRAIWARNTGQFQQIAHRGTWHGQRPQACL
jgi:hypothetical protein